MTWLGQVRHVIAKDVRQTRWPLALYAGVVAIATLQATQTTLRPPHALDVVTYLVVVSGMFVAALVVQGDSPTRADAFWASRPLYPSAVLVAKALLALVGLFGFAILAQSVVFVWLGEPSTMLVRHVIRSTWIYALWLVIAMVVASVTRDLRTFITTLAVVPLSFSFTRIPVMLGPQRLATPRLVLLAAAATGVAIAIALLVRLYRTRDGGRTTWTVAMVATAAILLSIFGNPWGRSTTPVVQQGSDRYEFYVEMLDGARGLYGLQFTVPRPIESDRITVVDSAVLRLRLNDGNTMRFVERPGVIVEYPTMPLSDGAQWLGGAPMDRTVVGAGIRTTSRQMDSLQVGIASASIDVWAWSARPTVLAVLPMRAGASIRRGGKVIRVVDVGRRDPEDSLAVISITWAAGPEAVTSVARNVLRYRTLDFALVNMGRREAIVPSQEERGGSVASMVLPGLWRNNSVAYIRSGIQVYRYQPPPTLDQAWFDEASVLVYDWTLAGRAHTTMENVEIRIRELPNATERHPPVAETPPASRSPQTRSP